MARTDYRGQAGSNALALLDSDRLVSALQTSALYWRLPRATDCITAADRSACKGVQS